MAFDGLITSLLGQGLAADRPVTPNIDPDAITFYFATDSNELSCYADGAWHEDALGLSAGDMLAANNLSDVDSVATARTNLGLAIGTDVQAFDADLSTLAANITAFGHSLVDDATAAAARTTLGISGDELIEEKSPTGGSTTFSSLPTGYRAFRIEAYGRTDVVATSTNIWLQFNGDTGNNYDWQYSQSTGDANSTPSDLQATNHAIAGVLTASTAVASAPGQAYIDIPQPEGTTFHKLIHFRGGLLHTAAGTGCLDFRGMGRWRNTAAITSITVLLDTGNFVAGTKIGLYGVR
jgi:hypothetical protein